MKTINEIKKKILKAKNTAIVCHQNPDGDTLGSAFALCAALSSLGRKSSVICSDTLPDKYSFMDEITLLNEYDTSSYDLTIFVDCAVQRLAGQVAEGIDIKAIDSINIDHHATNDNFAILNYVISTSSSTAEIILDLLKAMDIAIDKSIAEYLYIGMVTDTGQFAYSYTSDKTHENAAYLLRCGADFSALHKKLFRTIPYRKLALTQRMLEKHKMFEGGKIAFALLETIDFEECSATPQDSESLVNMLLSVEGVKTAALVRQLDEGVFKASFRSADDVDISKAAKLLGGGGHAQASGATLNCEESQVFDILLDAIKNTGII